MTGSSEPADVLARLRAAVDTGDAQQSESLSEAVAYLQSYPRGFIEEISPKDGMHNDAIPYFPAGRLALRCVRVAMLQSGRRGFESILDFGCGFGRVLRMLKAAYPEARLTACDVKKEGVDFCARVFGATPVYSADDPAEIELEGPFDLIWCGSVFSHFSADGWAAFLPFLESRLAPEGVLVFTTLGRVAAEPLRGVEAQWGLSPDGVAQLLADYDGQGFGFSQLAHAARPGNWGVALAKPSWVSAQIERFPTLRLVSYMEGAWGPQDAVGCARGPFKPSLPPA